MPPRGWRKPRQAETIPEPKCPSGARNHTWLILSPDGEVSRGRCRDCQEEKLFENSLPIDRGGSWRATKMSGLGSLSGPRPRETTAT